MAERSSIEDNASRTSSRPQPPRTKAKSILALVFIGICFAWVGYVVWSSQPKPYEGAPEADLITRVNQAISTLDSRKFENVSTIAEGDAPNLSVRVTGTVANAALLKELTQTVDGAANGKPVKVDVKVKP